MKETKDIQTFEYSTLEDYFRLIKFRIVHWLNNFQKGHDYPPVQIVKLKQMVTLFSQFL